MKKGWPKRYYEEQNRRWSSRQHRWMRTKKQQHAPYIPGLFYVRHKFRTVKNSFYLSRQALWVWGRAFSKRKLDGVWFDVRPYDILPFTVIFSPYELFLQIRVGQFNILPPITVVLHKGREVAEEAFLQTQDLMMWTYPIKAKGPRRHTILGVVIYAVLCCLKVQAQSEYVIPSRPNQWW